MAFGILESNLLPSRVPDWETVSATNPLVIVVLSAGFDYALCFTEENKKKPKRLVLKH